MSDGGPSIRAWQQFGQTLERTLEGTVLSIYDKVNAADAHSQYMQGIELLKKGQSDFLNSLATDPNPEGYLDKWNKYRDQNFKQATRTLTNQDAIAALKDDSETMNIKMYDKITGYQTTAKIEKIKQRAADTLEQTINNNSMATSDRKKTVRDIYTPLIAQGFVTADEMRPIFLKADKEIDQSAMEEELIQIARSEGYEYALNLSDDPDFTKLFPSLTLQDRDKVATDLEGRFRRQQQQAAIQDQKVNTDYDASWEGEYAKWLNNDPKVSAQSLFDMATKEGGFTRSELGDQYRIANITRVNQELKWREADARAKESQQRAEAGQRRAEINFERKNTDAVNQQLAIDIIIQQDWSDARKDLELKNLANDMHVSDPVLKQWRRMLGQSATFKNLIAEVQAMSRKGADGSDPILSAISVKEVQDDLLQLYENDPTMNVSDMREKLSGLIDGAKGKEAERIVKSLSSLVAERLKFGILRSRLSGGVEVTPGVGFGVLRGDLGYTASQAKTPRLPKQMTIYGTAKTGETIMKGDDGAFYFKDSSGTWKYSHGEKNAKGETIWLTVPTSPR